MQAGGEFNPFDPTGAFKQFRDTQMESWAKMMVDLVNTEAYAGATGAMLDAWLTASGPFQKALETTMAHVLAQLNLPSSGDVTRLAERLTNIEMRLDDLDAKIDDLAARGKAPATKKSKSNTEAKSD
jgi:polyhydroxyalkanoic acid synthase PhaR subunit